MLKRIQIEMLKRKLNEAIEKGDDIERIVAIADQLVEIQKSNS